MNADFLDRWRYGNRLHVLPLPSQRFDALSTKSDQQGFTQIDARNQNEV
jgi:hypothetical protein